MRDIRARPGQNVEVAFAPPVKPGVLVDENGMTEYGALAEDADFFGPLNRSYSVTAHHFLEFQDALRAMRGDGNAALAGVPEA